MSNTENEELQIAGLGSDCQISTPAPKRSQLEYEMQSGDRQALAKVDVQNLQRAACNGMSLKHSEHFRVVGSGCFFTDTISLLMGSTTRKYTDADAITNASRAFTKSPYKNLLPLIVKLRAEKSGNFAMAPMSGVSMSFTMADTNPAKAAPITIPTAKSTTFPRKRNCLNPLIACLRYRRILGRGTVCLYLRAEASAALENRYSAFWAGV